MAKCFFSSGGTKLSHFISLIDLSYCFVPHSVNFSTDDSLAMVLVIERNENIARVALVDCSKPG